MRIVKRYFDIMKQDIGVITKNGLSILGIVALAILCIGTVASIPAMILKLLLTAGYSAMISIPVSISFVLFFAWLWAIFFRAL